MAYTYAILTTVVVAIYVSCCVKLRFFRDAVDTNRRILNIDGIRGYLAIAVFVAHYVNTYHFRHSGSWGNPIEPQLINASKFAVDVFFMITGFLFTGKIFKGGDFDWRALAISRAFRIYPPYILVVTILFIYAISASGQLPTPAQLAAAVARWLFFIGGPIGQNQDPKVIIAGVHWTLRYEMCFYLLLPFIALLFRISAVWLLIIAIATSIFSLAQVQVSSFASIYLMNFVFGGIVAFASQAPARLKIDFDTAYCSLICAMVLALAFWCKNELIQLFLIALFFFMIVMGTTMFGLLTRPFSLLLGDMSFSIYLWHGMLLYTVFSLLLPDYALSHTFNEYLVFMPIFGICVVSVSFLSYRLVELPMINLGRHLQARYSRRKHYVSKAA